MAIDDAQLAAAVLAKAEALQDRLFRKVEANLSGDVLQERSGRLKSSIAGTLEQRGGVIAANITSAGVPYAAIQEHGGMTAPHEIVPVKAQALALAGGTFARRVAHPGSVLPGRRYMVGALETLAPEISGGLKQAVREALGAA